MKVAQYVVLGLLLSMMLFSQGCASLLVYENTRKELIRERLYASGNEEAQKLYESQGVTPKAFEPTFLDVVSFRPGRQATAGAVDLGVAYLGYKLYEAEQDSGKSEDDSIDDHSVTVSDNDGNVTIIQNEGDSNQNNMNGDQTDDGGSESGDGI